MKTKQMFVYESSRIVDAIGLPITMMTLTWELLYIYQSSYMAFMGPLSHII